MDTIQVGDEASYYGRTGDVCRGYVAECAVSPLTGNLRCRIVDEVSDMTDEEAGIWRNIEGDIIGVYPTNLLAP